MFMIQRRIILATLYPNTSTLSSTTYKERLSLGLFLLLQVAEKDFHVAFFLPEAGRQDYTVAAT
jgi:hypothetical protein